MPNPNFKQVYSPSEEDARIFKEGGQAAVEIFGEKVWLLLVERLYEMLLTSNRKNVKKNWLESTTLTCPDDVEGFISDHILKLVSNKVTSGELLNGFDQDSYPNLIPYLTNSRIIRGRIDNWARHRPFSLCATYYDKTKSPTLSNQQQQGCIYIGTGRQFLLIYE